MSDPHPWQLSIILLMKIIWHNWKLWRKLVSGPWLGIILSKRLVILLSSEVPQRRAVVQCVKSEIQKLHHLIHSCCLSTSHYLVVIKGTVLVDCTNHNLMCMVLVSSYPSEPTWLTGSQLYYSGIHPPSVTLPLLVLGIQPDERYEPQRPRLHVSSICFYDNSLNDVWAHKWLYRRLSLDMIITWNRNERSEAVNRLLRHAEHLY